MTEVTDWFNIVGFNAADKARNDMYGNINEILKPDYIIRESGTGAEIFDLYCPDLSIGELFLEWDNTGIIIKGYAIFEEVIKRLEKHGFKVVFRDLRLWHSACNKIMEIFKTHYSLECESKGLFKIYSNPEKYFQFPTSKPEIKYYRSETLCLSDNIRLNDAYCVVMDVIDADEFEEIRKKLEEVEGFEVIIRSSDCAKELKKYQRQG